MFHRIIVRIKDTMLVQCLALPCKLSYLSLLATQEAVGQTPLAPRGTVPKTATFSGP